jgi:hypothetical protein
MKKFSKLILETKNETRKMSALTNPVDWEEIFKPLIEHIEDNLKSNVQGPGNGVFTSRTKGLLDDFIDQVEEDYNSYFRDEIHDGSQEGFLAAYNINVDYRDIMDCIQPLLDRTDDVEDSGNFDFGAFVVDVSSIKYKDLDELIEDIEDIHLKLKMLKVNYSIEVNLISTSINISDTNTDISGSIKNQWLDSWGKKSESIALFNNANNSGIKVYVYNNETVQAIDLQ